METLLDASKLRDTIATLAGRVMLDPAVVAAGVGRVALVGIRNRGEIIAARLAAEIEKRTKVKPRVGALDITMYRDDLSGRKAITIPKGTDIPFAIDDAVVVLCDDVLGTGRSVRAALDALVAFGRPRIIRLLTLVDRGGREYPVSADYVGIDLKIERADEKVYVRVTPTDSEDAVYVAKRD